VENNLVENNFIGTDASGLRPLANTNAGVVLQAGASNNQIGAPGAGNVIAANLENVLIQGNTTSGNVVEANTLGLFADGRIGGGFAGVQILDGSNHNQIGSAGAGNVISGNTIGVFLGGVGTTANRVQGNFIGTDATGTVAVGNV